MSVTISYEVQCSVMILSCLLYTLILNHFDSRMNYSILETEYILCARNVKKDMTHIKRKTF